MCNECTMCNELRIGFAVRIYEFTKRSFVAFVDSYHAVDSYIRYIPFLANSVFFHVKCLKNLMIAILKASLIFIALYTNHGDQHPHQHTQP